MKKKNAKFNLTEALKRIDDALKDKYGSTSFYCEMDDLEKILHERQDIYMFAERGLYDGERYVYVSYSLHNCIAEFVDVTTHGGNLMWIGRKLAKDKFIVATNIDSVNWLGFEFEFNTLEEARAWKSRLAWSIIYNHYDYENAHAEECICKFNNSSNVHVKDSVSTFVSHMSIAQLFLNAAIEKHDSMYTSVAIAIINDVYERMHWTDIDEISDAKWTDRYGQVENALNHEIEQRNSFLKWMLKKYDRAFYYNNCKEMLSKKHHMFLN